MDFQCKDCRADISNQPRYPDAINNWYCGPCYQKRNPLKIADQEDETSSTQFGWWDDFVIWISLNKPLSAALGVGALVLLMIGLNFLKSGQDDGAGEGSGFSLFRSNRDKVKQQIEKLAESGTATKFQDLDIPEQSTEDNAFVIIKRAAQWLNPELKDKAIDLVRKYPIHASPDDNLSVAWEGSAAKAIEEAGDSMNKLEDLSPDSWSMPPSGLGPGSLEVNEHLNDIRTLSYLLRLNSLLWIHRGDAAQALISIDRQWLLSNSMRHEPWTISQTARVASLRFALRSVEQWIQKWRPDEELAEHWLNRFEQSDLESSLTLAIEGDQVHAFGFYQNPSSIFQVFKAPFGAEFSGDQRKQLQDQVESQLMKDFGLFSSQIVTVKDSLPLKYSDRLKQIERLKRDFLAADGDLDWNTKTTPPNLDSWVGLNRPVISTLMLPDVYQLISSFALAETYLRALRAALKIEIYRKQTGNEPANNLEEFSGSLRSSWPLDPYGGFPMFYQKVGGVYRIYSHGPEAALNVKNRESILVRDRKPVAEVYIDTSKQKTR